MKSSLLAGSGIALATACTLLAAPAFAAQTLTVCVEGCDYPTISSAVAAAEDGDTIAVRAGTYPESVDVTKTLTFVGQGDPRVVGLSYDEAAFDLAAPDVSIAGFTIGPAGAALPVTGIDVSTTEGARLHHNVIENNQRGVSLSPGASDVEILDSTVRDNNGSEPNNAGVWGDGVDGITITDSVFERHSNTAINLAGSRGIDISDSVFTDNGNVAVVWGDQDVVVAGNTGTGFTGSGVFVQRSERVRVTDNDLRAGGGTSGVSVSRIDGQSSDVRVWDNVLRDFTRGISVGDGAMADSLEARRNAFLTSTTGIRVGAGNPQVDGRTNYWLSPHGPTDTVAGDGSTPATNPRGRGVTAEGAVDYRSWCANLNCRGIPGHSR